MRKRRTPRNKVLGEEEEHSLVEGDLDGMQEDFKEHMVVEESISSARREEAAMHRMVEDSFETIYAKNVASMVARREET
jgi:hypothetical protein